MPKPTLQQRIKTGQRYHERDILGRVRKANKVGALWTSGIGFNMARNWQTKYNAITRLAKKGKIVHVPTKRRKNGTLRHGGWKLAGFACPGREWKECDSWGQPPTSCGKAA
ncbi:MAG: hypothetical protein KAJ19_21430 [Gammaproteobacteria bacterium]|nr:hypothetical protein [Gammaproteobacteria bacterium]